MNQFQGNQTMTSGITDLVLKICDPQHTFNTQAINTFSLPAGCKRASITSKVPINKRANLIA